MSSQLGGLQEPHQTSLRLPVISATFTQQDDKDVCTLSKYLCNVSDAVYLRLPRRLPSTLVFTRAVSGSRPPEELQYSRICQEYFIPVDSLHKETLEIE